MKSEFEKLVRVRLIETNRTLPDVAEAVNVSLGYIYELFSNPNKRSPFFKRIADYLDFELPKGD